MINENIKLNKEIEKLKKNYQQIKDLAPKEVSTVEFFDKETKKWSTKTVFRKYLSYGVSPEYNPKDQKSYMFNHKSNDVPKVLEGIFNEMKKRGFNNMYVNWYEEGHNHIEAHRDCDKYMKDDYGIAIITLQPDHLKPRILEFIAIDQNKNENMEATLWNGSLYVFDKDTNTQFKHRVGPGEGERISITFRMFKENQDDHSFNKIR